MEALEHYAEGTYSTLLYILLHICGVKNIHADHAASHIGKAWGICILLRGTMHHAQKQTTYLPASLCAKYGVTEEMIYACINRKEIEDVVFEVADHAKAHLDYARKIAKDVPKEANKILFPAV